MAGLGIRRDTHHLYPPHSVLDTLTLSWHPCCCPHLPWWCGPSTHLREPFSGEGHRTCPFMITVDKGVLACFQAYHLNFIYISLCPVVSQFYYFLIKNNLFAACSSYFICKYTQVPKYIKIQTHNRNDNNILFSVLPHLQVVFLFLSFFLV